MWLKYGTAAHGKGLRAAFAFPLQVGMQARRPERVSGRAWHTVSARYGGSSRALASRLEQMILDTAPRTPVRSPHRPSR